MNKFVLVFVVSLVCITTSCKNHIRYENRIIINPTMWNRETMILRAVAFVNEEHPYVDSVKVDNARKQIIFNIPDTLQRVYELSVKGRTYRVQLINDVPELHIKADFLGNRDSSWGSPATIALKNINKAQDRYNLKLQEIAELQERTILKGNETYVARLQQQYKLLVDQKNRNIIQIMDTVKNPAVWMAAYNQVDFDKDFGKLSRTMSKGVKKFPVYKPIQLLKTEVDNYISIYTQELQVGDTLPFINLTDQKNNPFSTLSFKGKYYYIDFWASWCTPCMPYSEPKRQAYKTYVGKDFKMVSVFLDDNVDAWREIIKAEHFDWPQLIDKKQWSGVAVRALKFDSIPFNYLVNPNGKIIAKAIPADKLLNVLGAKIKKK